MSHPIPVDPAMSPAGLLARLPIAGRAEIAPAESPYPLPNIPEEDDRLSLQHFILRAFLRGNSLVPSLHSSAASGTRANIGTWTNHILDKTIAQVTAMPVTSPRRILDVGCGNGRWGVEMARRFPQAVVTGVDVVAPAKHYADAQPMPPNYVFVQGNILRGLSFADGTFDYVHMRFVNLGIPSGQWQPVINELGRLIAPGGWLECIEGLLPVETGPAFARYNGLFGAILAARQIDLAQSRKLDSYVRQSPYRFHQIQSRMVELPIGAHGGFIGLSMAWNMVLGIQNMRAFCLQAGLIAVEEWEPLLRAIDEEFGSTTYQAVMPLHIVVAQHQG